MGTSRNRIILWMGILGLVLCHPRQQGNAGKTECRLRERALHYSRAVTLSQVEPSAPPSHFFAPGCLCNCCRCCKYFLYQGHYRVVLSWRQRTAGKLPRILGQCQGMASFQVQRWRCGMTLGDSTPFARGSHQLNLPCECSSAIPSASKARTSHHPRHTLL